MSEGDEGDEGDDYEYPVEPFEPVNAGGESADESDNSPESARRPSLKAKKRFVPQSRDEFEGDNDVYDDNAEYTDGMAGLDNADSDEDDPANSPTKRKSRKVNSRVAQFTSPISTSVTTKLPAKKKTKGAQSLRQETAEHSGVQIPTSGNTGFATPPPSEPEGSSTSSDPPAQTAAIVSNRAQIQTQSQTSQGILKIAIANTRLDILIKDAFPERLPFTDRSKAIFLVACQEYGTNKQHARSRANANYRKDILAILRQKLSQVRQEVRNMAIAKTALHYGISSLMDRGDIVERVRELQKGMAFTFEDTERKKPFGNTLFQIIINALFFEGKRKSDAINNPVPWNPMPLPIIALVVTAVHSVLDDWATGVNEAARNQFSKEKYEPAYREYIANLEKF
ncbi:hypothetical protein FRB90_010208 [Tulasnella sp. 427]|nr:hypothetical protein FRB90_010208 [Tulasnella sp. 427]